MKTAVMIAASTALLYVVQPVFAGDDIVNSNHHNTYRNNTAYGGHGGTGIGLGVGVAKANAQAHQRQNQNQGQLQGQISSNRNISSTKNSGNSSNRNVSSTKNSGNSTNRNVLSATGSGNSTSVTLEGSDYHDMYKQYTPDAATPPMPTTAPCFVGVSAGIGIPGFSGSFGGFKYDQECEFRETIRLAFGSSNVTVRNMANVVLVNKLALLNEELHENDTRKVIPVSNHYDPLDEE